MAKVIRPASGWKCAWGISWIIVLGLLGLTAAQVTQFGGMVQFFGNKLLFNWQDEPASHHYRVLLTQRDMSVSPPVDTCLTLYCDEPSLEVPTLAGYAYGLRVQGLSAAGDTSALSQESPFYLCLGESSQQPDQIAAPLPQATGLGDIYPNPFNLSANISYSIAPAQGNAVTVSLKIYNTLGQEIRRIVDRELPPGQYRAIWDGRNDQGAVVSTGTYLCRLQTGEQSSVRLLVLAK